MFANRSILLSSLVALATFGTANAQDFLWRMYAESDCSHNAPAGNTYPANNLSPNSNNFNICVSAPTGTNWQRVEQSFAGATVYTFCDINCGGGESGAQITTCASPVAGCAIGSL